ncbi:MAG: hypothetical protein K0Q55_3705 [Verrucomicrobia bacterium]|nr:hypothetical protein [Verrucomicrobiota bacterium]
MRGLEQTAHCQSSATLALLLGGLRLFKTGSPKVEISSARYRFNWSPRLASRLQSLSQYVSQHSRPEERIIIFSPHDYHYFIYDRKPALDYFYTWYEPFHDAKAAERVIAALKSENVKLVISNWEDPFALAFAPDYRSHPIYQTLTKEFEPKSNPSEWGPFVIWEKKSPLP